MIETKTWDFNKNECGEHRRMCVHLPGDLEAVTFTIKGHGTRDLFKSCPVVWVRSRKVPSPHVEIPSWSQSVCFPMEEAPGGWEVVKTINLGTLWLTPKEVFEFEVTAEYFDLDVVEIGCIVPDKVEPMVVIPPPSNQSWMDNPIVWAVLLVLGVILSVWVVVHRT